MGERFNFLNRLKEPVVLKDDHDTEKQLDELKALLPRVNEEGREIIEKDIKKLEYGIVGEKQILFELKNSHMPMYIIHNLYLSDGEQQAQIDYLVVTKKICFVIECKNLYGDIEINEKGEFIRRIQFGKYYKKEGIYSPITQNQRHMELLKKIKSENKTNIFLKVMGNMGFDDFYKSVVVLANPSTVLKDKKAPKDIKKQVIRGDQLIKYIKDKVKESKEFANSSDGMEKWATNILKLDTQKQMDYTAKYMKYIGANDNDLKNSLKKYRLNKSKEENTKAYIIFTDKQLDALIDKKPKNKDELLLVSGFGEKKIEKYGDDILEEIRKHA
ncbi:MAG: NERD domain-containing protein [Anaerostipes sp.]|nr:NERD domain-containing protein [Anaerostipes sp.]